MTREKLEARIARLAEPFIASLELELWGIELSTASRPLVRIFVDNEEGATIDQCARISRHLGVALEAEDVMQSAYILEVSSPGLERPFFQAAQMAKYIGRQIELSLLDPNPEWPGRRKFYGELISVDGEDFVLKPMEHPVAPVEPKPNAKARKKQAAAANASPADETVDASPLHDQADKENAADTPMLRAHWSEVKKAHLIHVFPEPGHNKPKN